MSRKGLLRSGHRGKTGLQTNAPVVADVDAGGVDDETGGADQFEAVGAHGDTAPGPEPQRRRRHHQELIAVDVDVAGVDRQGHLTPLRPAHHHPVGADSQGVVGGQPLHLHVLEADEAEAPRQ